LVEGLNGILQMTFVSCWDFGSDQWAVEEVAAVSAIDPTSAGA
jgi:hypothetical protein